MWEPIKAERKRDEDPRMASYLRPKHVVSGTRILMLACGGVLVLGLLIYNTHMKRNISEL